MHKAFAVLGAALLIAACSTNEISGPLSPTQVATVRASESRQIVNGDIVVVITNNLFDQAVLENFTGEYPGAWAKIRWNGHVPGGSGESFQIDVAWTPSCTFGVPLGHGFCIGTHLEVTFDNEHSFQYNELVVKKYILNFH